MKRLNTQKNKLLALVLGLTLSFSAFAQKTADFVFIHDVHDFLNRLASAKLFIDEQKAINPETFILDAGDFSMGTLYQTVFQTQAPELRILGALGIEATTLGNHEFDYGSKALAQMLDVARTCGEKVPLFTVANANWDRSFGEANLVKEALDRYGSKNYHVINHNGFKIAVFGLFGKDSLFCAPTCEVGFDDIIESAKKTVADIKAKENVDMIVCISHSGTDVNPEKSEDELLAKAVPEIDLIISGHTHTVLEKPIVHEDTSIVSCGAYSQYLGTLSVSQKTNGRWEISKYKLIPITDSMKKDSAITAKLDKFAKSLDQEYLSHFGYTTNQILTHNPYPLREKFDVGYLMADTYINTVEKFEVPGGKGASDQLKGTGKPVDVSVVPSGCIRGTYQVGNVSVKDAFNSFSLGIGPDGYAGYPLLSVYVKGQDIINSCEIDCTLSPSMDTVRLFLGGIVYEYNPKRLPLNKVTNVYITRNGKKEKVDPKKLYRLVSDSYTGAMLDGVTGVTFGLLSITPRDSTGKPIENLDDYIIYVKEGELKGWSAIAKTLETMDSIPDYSKAEENAIICKPSINPFNLLAKPSKLSRIIRAVVLVLVLIIAGIAALIVKFARKAKSRK